MEVLSEVRCLFNLFLLIIKGVLLVDADLLDLRNKNLKKSHDRLQGQFLLPALNLEPIKLSKNIGNPT